MPPLSRSPSAAARPLAKALVCAAASVAGLAAAAAASDWGNPLFSWTDGEGVVRYTTHPNQVPLLYRDSLREVRRLIEERESGAPAYPSGSEGVNGGAGGPATAGSAPGALGTAAVESPGRPSPSAAAGPPELSSLDREIAALKAKIAHDEELLKTLISDPEAAPQLARSGDLAAIAERLPAQQTALRELLAERERVRDGG